MHICTVYLAPIFGSAARCGGSGGSGGSSDAPSLAARGLALPPVALRWQLAVSLAMGVQQASA